MAKTKYTLAFWFGICRIKKIYIFEKNDKLLMDGKAD